MVISFFGHSDFRKRDLYENTLIKNIKEISKHEPLTLFFGEYGEFDRFAYSVCKNCNEISKHSHFVFVTPYLNDKINEYKSYYDEILYPPLEKVPLKLAIIYRNRWIVDNSDYIFFYVSRNFGGAHKAFEYAQKRGKNFLNLKDVEI